MEADRSHEERPETTVGHTSAVALSDFRRGALLGAVSMLAIGGLVVVVAVTAWLFISRDEPPNPTATRQDVVGTVTQLEPRVCVEAQSDGADETVAEVWCGLAEGGVAPAVSVGDAVSGSIIGVELDPGSGYALSFWESLNLRDG